MLVDNLPESKYFAQEVCIAREKVLAETRVGKVIEKTLLKTTPRDTRTPDILTEILMANTPEAREKDRVLFRKLIRNANNRFPAIGKPSSAFTFIEKGRVYLDFLRENPNFDRDVNLHDYLRVADAQGSNRYQHAETLLSGHLAMITPEYQESGPYHYVMLLDKVESSGVHLSPKDKHVINALHANGIIPITSSTHPSIIFT